MPFHTVFAMSKNNESFVFNHEADPCSLPSLAPDVLIKAATGKHTNTIAVHVEEFP